MNDHISLIVLGFLGGISILLVLADSFATNKRIKRLETTVSNLEAAVVHLTNQDTDQ